MENMIIGFFALTCLVYPTTMIYSKGGAFADSSPTIYGRYTLGNLGYSTVQFQHIPMHLDKLALQCPFGYIRQIVSKGTGINPSTT